MGVPSDVVSPELVLVSSPEEARRARERLPAQPWLRSHSASASSASFVDVLAVPRPPHLRLVDENSVARPSPRFLSAAPFVALLTAVAMLGYLTERLWPDGPSGSRSPFVPARSWSWAAAPGARAYEVMFYREGRLVLDARTRQNGLRLPVAFRFAAGRYRWTVWSVPLVEGERPIADSTFVLSSDSADVANARVARG